MSTNLAWVCTCAPSTSLRMATGNVIAISPHGKCRDCGRTYDEANGRPNQLEGVGEYVTSLLKRAKEFRRD